MSNTREKLMKIVRQKEAWLPNVGTSAMQTLRLVDHLIANGVTVQEWIPVTERLPEDEELVLILCKNGARFVGYCGKQYADFERRWRIKTALNSTKLLNVGRVTHWMPLPQPPKGE